MKLTKKQQKTLKIIEWFIPDIKDWNSKLCRITGYGVIGLNPRKKNWKTGISAEEAFFLKTERGKLAGKVTNTPRLASLLYGQNRMALHVTTYKEDFEGGILHPQDFIDEPLYIQELAKKCCEQVGRFWTI